MPPRGTLDDTDRAIVERLRTDARRSHASIGGDLGLTEGAVRHRVARMIAEGQLLRFTVIARPLGPEGLVLIRCRPGQTQAVVDWVRTVALDLFETSGAYDLAASVEADSMAAFNAMLDRIRTHAGVESTETLVRLTRYVGPADASSGAARPRRSTGRTPRRRGGGAPPRRPPSAGSRSSGRTAPRRARTPPPA